MEVNLGYNSLRVKQILIILQIIVSLALTALILIQARGTGFGRTMSASSASFSRRGLEKIVFRSTFVLAFIFIAISFLQLLL